MCKRVEGFQQLPEKNAALSEMILFPFLSQIPLGFDFFSPSLKKNAFFERKSADCLGPCGARQSWLHIDS